MKISGVSMCHAHIAICGVLWLMAQTHLAGASVQVHNKFMGVIAHATDLQDDPGKMEQGDADSSLAVPEMITKATTSVKWTGKSNFSHHVQLLVAAVWVLMLGSVPLLIFMLDDKRKATKSGIILSCVMWIGLFGGLYLFTTTILFQSSHFDKVRSLTVIECVYFMTQVITTVGYGDITPAYHRGQMFVGMYVVVSFFVIALLLSEMQGVVMARVSKYKEALESRIARGSARGSKSLVAFKPDPPSAASLTVSALFFVTIAVTWTCFFALYPGENKTWGEAVYMALITLSTVGFGAVTPKTEGGMLFGAFFMFLGSSSLVGCVTNFSTFSLQMSEWEAWNPEAFQKDLKKLTEKEGHGHAISELDFVAFTLVHKNIVSQEQFDAIKEAYADMKKSPRGTVRKSLSVKRLAHHNGLDAAAMDMSDSEDDDDQAHSL